MNTHNPLPAYVQIFIANIIILLPSANLFHHLAAAVPHFTWFHIPILEKKKKIHISKKGGRRDRQNTDTENDKNYETNENTSSLCRTKSLTDPKTSRLCEQM